MEKIKYVKSFCEAFNKVTGEEEKADWILKQIEIKTFIPTEEKINSIKRIVSSTVNKHERDANGKIIKTTLEDNSIVRAIFLRLNFINLYTNIEIDFDKAIEQYDALKSCGLLDIIIHAIPESEFEEMTTFARLEYDDIFTNKYEIHSYINELVDTVVGALGLTIAPEIKTLVETLSDEVKFKKMIELVKK